MLTDPQIRFWLDTLEPDPKSDKPFQRTTRGIVQDLLNHAVGDKMLTEDRQICVRALELLAEEDSAEGDSVTETGEFIELPE